MDTGLIIGLVILAVTGISAIVGADLSWRNASQEEFGRAWMLTTVMGCLAPGLALSISGSWSWGLAVGLAIVGGFLCLVAYVLAALVMNTNYKILWRKK